jgi:formate dehydrogenase iron-sulfur subunit
MTASRVYVPGDTSARSLGADAVALALATGAQQLGQPIELVRNGSRGMAWLEPLVEVQTAAGRVAYGPVDAAAVPGLLAAGLLEGGAHALRIGDISQHPWMRGQQRLCFARVGVVDPLSGGDYLRHGGLAGLRRALELGAERTLEEVLVSGLRGRGGAAFPTGLKWRTVRSQPAARRFIACNADEGDSGTFADRMLIEGDPFTLIEGMAIAGLAVGAERGYIYLRCEYPLARRALESALAAARAAGWLGTDLLGSGQGFDIELRLGAGAYVCGEETSMLESLEGRRGEVRVRPPLPAVRGLFGAPTVVNNVVTLASVPWILAHGGAAYRGFGAGESRGTLPLQLGGNVRQGGLLERGFDLTLRELIEDFGGGTASGRPVRAVQVGGPLGAWLPADGLEVRLDYESLAARGALLGHGGVVVCDDSVDMARMARVAMAFCAHESCGKCTPCRLGSQRGVELLDRLLAARGPFAAGGRSADGAAGSRADGELALLEELCTTMEQGSLCGLGGMTHFPVRSALRHFRSDFGA